MTRSHLDLVVHPPVKSGLILQPEYPWEPLIIAFNNLIKVNDSDYRIYYDVIGAAPLSVDPSGQNGYRFLCVATSKDGLTGWTKPLLPHVPFHNGLTNTTHNFTNIVGGAKHLGGSNIIYDPRSQRFIGFADGFSYVSEDGFLFTIANCRPVHTGCVCGPKGKQIVASCRHLNFSSPNGVMYDPDTQQYNVFFRTLKPRPDKHFCPGGDPSNPIPPGLRSIGMITTPDLLAPDWGPGDHSDFAQYGYNTTVFSTDDEDDPCISAYSSNPFKLGDMFAMAPMMFLNCNDTHSLPTGPKGSYPRVCEINPAVSPKLPPVNRKDRSDGYLEAGFAVSRTGRHYSRLSREAFVPRGIGHPRVGFPGVFEGAFDSASTTVAAGTYNVGDVTVLIESGWQATHAGIDAVLDPALAPNLHPSGTSKLPGGAVLSGIQLLTSRRNGLVAMQTTQPSVEGVWLSKSLRLPTCGGSPGTPELGLSLNCMASIDGYLLPSLLTSGKHTPSTLMGVPIIGNLMDEPVRWRNQTKLLDEINPVALPRVVQGAVAQLRVVMKEAQLFAFKFECIAIASSPAKTRKTTTTASDARALPSARSTL
jgi:hypothetical protein